MIKKYFLYQLSLLQAEQYDTGRYWRVCFRPPDFALITRLKWTVRMKLTAGLAAPLFFIFPVGITFANFVTQIPRNVWEMVTWHRARQRIAYLKQHGLRVVAIAGSYGKTSVKHYAYELLRHDYRVVATPESFNTIFGIAKCLRWEVDSKTQIFLAEVGAFHRGDITHLLGMVQPEIGMLTGIARQHLERFGSWENIKLAKGEIAEYMQKTQGKLVANGADETVREVVTRIGVEVAWYGSEGQDRHQINLEGGQLLAKTLGMSQPMITARSKQITAPRSRFELTRDRYGMAVIDDSFSSNDRGFVDAVHYLGRQKKYTRILVTPGLVELGSESDMIHEELGRAIVDNADLVILVGKNVRTASLEKGIAGRVKTLHIEKTLEFTDVVNTLKLKKEPLVLLENDVTENY